MRFYLKRLEEFVMFSVRIRDPRSIAAALAFSAVVPVQALEPGFPETQLQQLQAMGGLFGGSVAIGQNFLLSANLCSGTMLTSNIVLTAAHCFAETQADAASMFSSFRSRGLEVLTPNDSTNGFQVAQGERNLFTLVPGLPLQRGFGATSFGQIESLVMLPHWRMGVADLAIAVVRQPSSSLLAGNVFSPTAAALATGNETLLKVDYSASNGVTNRVFGLKVGHSFGSVTERRRLGSVAVLGASGAPEYVASLGQDMWAEYAADVTSASLMNVAPAGQPPDLQPNLGFRQSFARLVKGDSGGGLFARTTMGAPLLLGVAKGVNSTVETWVPIEDHRQFIIDTVQALAAMSLGGRGASPQYPVMPSQVVAGPQGQSIKVFSFEALAGTTWLDPDVGAYEDIRLSSAHKAVGLALNGQVPSDLRLFEIGSDGETAIPLAYEVMDGSRLRLERAVAGLRVMGLLPRDEYGQTVLGFDFVSLGDDPTVSLQWASSPVPELSSGGALSLGLLALAAALGFRRREQSKLGPETRHARCIQPTTTFLSRR